MKLEGSDIYADMRGYQISKEEQAAQKRELETLRDRIADRIVDIERVIICREDGEYKCDVRRLIETVERTRDPKHLKTFLRTGKIWTPDGGYLAVTYRK